MCDSNPCKESVPGFHCTFTEIWQFGCSENIKLAYCHIKLLHKCLLAKTLSNFMIKKLLMKEKFQRLDKANRAEDRTFHDLFFKILSEPETEMSKVLSCNIILPERGFVILDNQVMK